LPRGEALYGVDSTEKTNTRCTQHMNLPQTFPVDYTDSELSQRAADLSARVVDYNTKTGNGEELIRDSVLFNVTYIELQNRKASRATGQMVWLTWASASVAIASLAVAWLAYDAGRSADTWQEKQLLLLKQIATDVATAKQLHERTLKWELLPNPGIPASSPKGG
jgi:hypothetical protein